MRLASLAAVVLLLAPRAALAADYINDPLTEGSFAGRGSQGGTFDASGWTTTGPTDTIWYEIPDALVTGKVGFSVLGMGYAGGPLKGADHDILAVYQAPSGQGEPVAYSPYFRNNDFKAFLRVFGDLETGRSGAMKLEFIKCPRGEPWYHDEPCTPECGVDLIGYANGTDKDIGWDTATWYRIELAWSPGSISFSRNGQQLSSLSFDGTYAPKPLRVRLGSPRHGISAEAFMPQGLVFKDVSISGDGGEMTAVCSSGAGGSGQAGSGGSGGSGQAGSGAGGNELAPIQDVTAASWLSGVFDDINDLNVEGDGTNPTSVAYLRFPPLSGSVTKAILRVRAHPYGSASGSSGVVHGVADSSWDENTLTWAARPAFDPTAYGSPVKVTEDAYAEWDVTPLVAAGTYNFAIVSTDADGAHFRSKEAEGGANAPRLIVTVDPSGAGGSGPAAGSGGSSAGSSASGSGGSAQAGSAQAGSSQAGSSQGGSAQAGSPQAGSAGAGASGGQGGSGGAKAGAGGAGGAGGKGGAGGAGGSAGQGGKAGAAGSKAGSGQGNLSPNSNEEASDDDGGCGCRAAGRADERAGFGAVAVLLLAGVARRRRRTRLRSRPHPPAPSPASWRGGGEEKNRLVFRFLCSPSPRSWRGGWGGEAG